MKKKFLVTGGAGFIGSAVIRHLIAATDHSVVNLDALTYAGSLDNLKSIETSDRYTFVHEDIRNKDALSTIITFHQPDIVMHLAAESHVDRSIDAPSGFIQTNIIGTYNLLESCRFYLASHSGKKDFRFHHVSTDEVYGELTPDDAAFTEQSPYNPNSPYSASKASADHLVRSWSATYGLPVVITNCSNNYGPYQFPEKLIPHCIIRAVSGKTIPVYGDGKQVRDWLHVDDHARALIEVALNGQTGETYNIGGQCEVRNIEIVSTICALLDARIAEKPSDLRSFSELIEYVTDRPGHDYRYAIDNTKIRDEMNWQPQENLTIGLQKTVDWYLDNRDWWQSILLSHHGLERKGKGLSP